MDAALGYRARRPDAARAKFLGVALAVASTFLVAGGVVRFGRTFGPPPPPAACLVATPDGYRALDYVDNLETCGARLEALYLEHRRPVAGAYGGQRVFADMEGIDAASPHGPRQSLIPAPVRERVDAGIRRLMRAQQQKGVVPLDIGPTGSS